MIVVASARAIELKRQKAAMCCDPFKGSDWARRLLEEEKGTKPGKLYDMWMRRLRRISTCGTALLELIRCSWFPELVFGIEIYPLRVRIQQLADKFFEARRYRDDIPVSEL
jgi:hypothetical protein